MEWLVNNSNYFSWCGGWGGQEQSSSRLPIWFRDAMSSCVEGVREILGVSLTRALIPYHTRGPCLQRPSHKVAWADFLEDSFPTDWEGDGFPMIKVHYIYCALYFYCYHISPTSDHQISDSGGWVSWHRGLSFSFLGWYIWSLTLNLLFSCSVVSDSFANPWTIARQASLFMEFSRQENWSGSHFLLQGIFPTQGSNLGLLHWQVDSLLPSHLVIFCNKSFLLLPLLITETLVLQSC